MTGYETKRTIRYAAAVRIAREVAVAPGAMVPADDLALWSAADIEAMLRATGWLWADDRQQWIHVGD